MEIRIKIVDKIYSEEGKVQKSKPKSVLSDKSRSTKHSMQSSTSRSSARSHRIAEHKMRKLQLLKEISMAEAEENVIKNILDEDNGLKSADSQTDQNPVIGTIGEDNCKDNKSSDKLIYQESEKQSIKMNPYSPPFVPKLEPSQTEPLTSAELKPNIKAAQNQKPNSLNESMIKELIKLQDRQTELSTAIAHQQRINSLPVREPPMFSGDVMDYPIFIQAFETIIESEVEASRDRLFFLNKYTTGRANDVIKGFVAMNTGNGYKQAKKLLAQKFGDPYHVAESFKSRLRGWARICEGESSGIQEFSDFLIRCREAMKSMRYMSELNSTETLVQVSAKLPSYSSVEWCHYACDLRERTKDVVLFNDLADFVKLEAELATDPVFSPNALKRERNKESNSLLMSSRPEANQSKPK